MYIIKFQGGLGNQMFQYALYYILKAKGNIVKADLNHYRKNKGTPRKYLLEDYFNIRVEIASNEDIRKLYAGEEEFVKKAIIKRLGKKTYYREPVDSLIYHPEIFSLSSGYLEGFWQCEKYFSDFSDDIRKIYRLNVSKNISGDKNKIAVHVRLGDYTEKRNKKIYGNICTKEYYNNAIEYIKDKVNNPIFYIFSDDVNSAKHILKDQNNLRFVEHTNENDEKNDFEMMASCDHQIIANSSFSWWAAWLNDNPDKIVIAPSRWINSETMNDVTLDCWVKI